MEELEDPTERLKEIKEAAEEMSEEKEKWMMHVALSTAIIAVLAAIAGLFGNHHSNEAVLLQIKASDKWSYYQSKSIKYELEASTAYTLKAMGKDADTVVSRKMAGYAQDKENIKKSAEQLEEESAHHMKQHVTFSWAITIFQISIAMSAVGILTRKKPVWYVCLALSAIATVISVIAFLS